MHMKRFSIFFSILFLAAGSLSAQPALRIYRTPFVSYDVRSDAEAARSEASQMYSPVLLRVAAASTGSVAYTGLVTVPEQWLDRRVVLHTEGNMGRMNLFVNGEFAGRCTDSRAGAEFDITPFVNFGVNGIALEVSEEAEGAQMECGLKHGYSSAEGRVWVSAQPIISIYDYSVSAVRDTTGRDGVLTLDIVVRNGFRTDETLSVGYDIYTPEGKLRNYNVREIAVPRLSMDTVRFTEAVWSAGKWLWSAAKPNLYKVMLYIKYGGKVIEYVPLKIGFGTSEFKPDGFYRNGEKTALSAVNYNASTRKDAEEKMLAFKRRGINAVCVDFPQPAWFYDLCDSKGFYVLSSANIHADPKGGDRGLDGTVANDPKYLDEFIGRVRSAYSRDRNRTCVIGWSLGSDSGNGYNMYKAYRWMKNADTLRPVIYAGADGEWNSDLPPVEAQSVEQVLKLNVRRR